MDLSSKFGQVDPSKAVDGVWFPFLEDGRVRIRPFGTQEHRMVTAEVTERYRAHFTIGGQLEIEARRAIRQEVAAIYHIADWENLADEGQPLPCTNEVKLAMIKKYDDFLVFVEQSAAQAKPYRLNGDMQAHRD